MTCFHSFVWKQIPLVPCTDLLHEALKDLVIALGASGDQGLPINPKEAIKRAVGASFYALMFGESPHGHPEFAEVTEFYSDLVMNFYKQGPFVLEFAKYCLYCMDHDKTKHAFRNIVLFLHIMYCSRYIIYC